MSNRDWLARNIHAHEEIVDVAAPTTGAFYAAIRDRRKGADAPITCLVVATHYTRDHWNFTWKMIDESMGPVEARCPKRILALLSPVEECGYSEQGAEWAREWRERCHAYHAKRAECPRPRRGDRILFDRAISFADDTTHRVLTYVKRGRLQDPATGRFYRVGDLRSHGYRVLARGEDPPTDPPGALEAALEGAVGD